MFALRGVGGGGFGWRMFEEMLGAHGFDFFALRGWGECRWLMFEEVLGAFTASIFSL